MDVLFLVGRVLFGGYFVYSGINHFMHHDMMKGYAQSKGVASPHVAVPGTGAMMVAGGASIATGYQPKIGAALIIAFLLGVSPQMHDFWNIEDQGQKMNDMINFTKNMALVGAALTLLGRPEPWPLSLGAAEPDEGSPGLVAA